MVCSDGSNDGVYFTLAGYFAAIYRNQPVIIPAQQQVVIPASKPQWHGVFQWQARPVGDAPPAQRVPLHQRKLRFDNPRGDGGVVPAAVLGLKFDAQDNLTIFHHAMSEIVCHIALSSCDP
jgi:hypothetical protein